jgi:hypothetical protein
MTRGKRRKESQYCTGKGGNERKKRAKEGEEKKDAPAPSLAAAPQAEQICVANENRIANAKTIPKLLAYPHNVNASTPPATPITPTVSGRFRSLAQPVRREPREAERL